MPDQLICVRVIIHGLNRRLICQIDAVLEILTHLFDSIGARFLIQELGNDR